PNGGPSPPYALDYHDGAAPPPAAAPVTRPLPTAGPVRAGWLYAAALATSLAFLTKGGPGLFPLVFLPAFCAVTGRWDVLRRFVTTGAVVVVLVLGMSWYAYAASQSGLKQFFQELRVLRTGEDHGGTFLIY